MADHRIVQGEGTQRVVHEQADVTYSEVGEPLSMFGTVQDIPERRQLEEQLRHARKMGAEKCQ